MKFRKKPVVIEAVQLTWATWNEICEFVPEEYFVRGVYFHKDGTHSREARDPDTDRMGLVIHTLEGDMLAMEGDWIIRGIKGEFYPCKPDIFKQTYEPIDWYYDNRHS